jgi:hypothetical protein
MTGRFRAVTHLMLMAGGDSGDEGVPLPGVGAPCFGPVRFTR